MLVLGGWAVAAVCTFIGQDIWERFFFLFGFFVLGHHVILNPGPVQRLLANPYAVAVMIVLTLGMPVAALVAADTVRYEPISIPMALGAVGLMLIGMSAIGEKRYLALFRYIGRNSLQVYVLHFTIIAIAVIAATRILGISNPPTVFVIGLTGGFFGSLLAVWLIRALNLGMLFNWPRPAKQPAKQAASGARVSPHLAAEPHFNK
jgi:fucose 4-O-acetylase-like acetyltransferase